MFSVSKEYINCRCGLHLDEYQSVCPNTGKLGIINSNGKFTSCHDHKHITRQEYNIVVPQIIDEFLEYGFTETVRYFEKDINEKDIFKSLKCDLTDINEITAQKTTKSNKIIRKYMPHIYEVEDYKGNSIRTLWTEDNLTRAFKLLDKPNYTVNSQLSELFKKLKYTPVTIYSPIMTKRLLETLDCKNVFDPCIGWGGRMVGTTVIDGSYTGCEPFKKTFDGLQKLANDLDINDNINIYNEPVEDVLHRLNDIEFDICLTSPPYYNLEVYSHEETQSIKRYKSYEEWLEGFIKPIIEYVCTHVTKYSCWSVKDFKTDQKYNLFNDIKNIHEENNWILDRQFAIGKTTKNGKTNGDITYVFKKKNNMIEKEKQLEKVFIFANPDKITKLSEIKKECFKEINNDSSTEFHKITAKAFLTGLNSSQCNELYEENLSEILGITNLEEKHGWDGYDEEENIYYEYKPTKIDLNKKNINPLSSKVSINDDSLDKIEKCRKDKTAKLIIAVIDKETSEYIHIYKFLMNILSDHRKNYYNKERDKKSKRIVYSTNIKTCILLSKDQNIEYHVWSK